MENKKPLQKFLEILIYCDYVMQILFFDIRSGTGKQTAKTKGAKYHQRHTD